MEFIEELGDHRGFSITNKDDSEIVFGIPAYKPLDIITLLPSCF